MSSISIYNPHAIQKPKPRKVDYQLIYQLKDAGIKGAHIKRRLDITEGTYRHALKLREKERIKNGQQN
jgi:hypothetical protein